MTRAAPVSVLGPGKHIPNDKTEQHGPEQAGIFEGRHEGRLGQRIGLREQQNGGRRSGADEAHQKQMKCARHGPGGGEIAEAWMRRHMPSATAEEQSQNGRENKKGKILVEADDQGRDARPERPGEHVAERIAGGCREHDERGRLEDAAPWPDDDDDADEGDDHGEPLPAAPDSPITQA